MTRGSVLIIRFILFLILILSTFLVDALPATKHPSSAKKPRPVIALVLSGGGAKGAAHIGVISVLEKYHVPIDIIVGTSIGSYVGGLSALGYNAQEIKALMFNIDWTRGFSDFIPRQELLFADKKIRDKYNITFPIGFSDGQFKMPKGLLLGQSALQVLKESTGNVGIFKSFDALPIRYRAVATDLVTSKAVILRAGSITKVMKASSTVPGALGPTHLEGKLLVDGGISKNLPVSVARRLGADIIIAVDIGSSLLPKNKIHSTIDVLNQLSTIMTVNTTNAGKKLLHLKHDLLIRPDVSKLSTTDFSHLDVAYKKGKEAALAQKVRLQALSISDKDYAIYQAKKRAKKKRWMAKLIRPTTDIIYNNNSHVNSVMIAEHFGLVSGKVISKKELAAAVQRVYALNRFEYVNAQFEDTESGRILTLTTREKSWGPNYLHMGVGWEGDLNGRLSEATIDFAYILTDITDNGGIWKNQLTLGWETGASSEFYQPLDKKQLFFSRSTIQYKESNFLENKHARFGRRAEFYDRYGQVRLGVGSNYTNNGFSEIGALASVGELSYDNEFGTYDGVTGRVSYTNYGGYLDVAFDNLNSRYMPTSGNKTDLKFIIKNDDFGDKTLNDTTATSLQIKFDWRGAFEIGNHSFVGISSFATLLTKGKNTTHLSELGGFLNLSGYSKDALIGAHKAFAAVVYKYDLGRLSDGIGVPIYLGSSLEAGNTWVLKQKINLNDLIGSSSLFLGTDTSYGPAIIGVGYAANIKNLNANSYTIFFSIGKKW